MHSPYIVGFRVVKTKSSGFCEEAGAFFLFSTTIFVDVNNGYGCKQTSLARFARRARVVVALAKRFVRQVSPDKTPRWVGAGSSAAFFGTNDRLLLETDS